MINRISTKTTIDEAMFESLKQNFCGLSIRPDGPDYNSARRVW